MIKLPGVTSYSEIIFFFFYLSHPTGWTTEDLEFEPRQGQEFSLFNVVHTASGVHPTSYPMGTESYLPGGKAAGA
jgi:hypothetical protein